MRRDTRRHRTRGPMELATPLGRGMNGPPGELRRPPSSRVLISSRNAKKRRPKRPAFLIYVPGGIRTPDNSLRRRVLYPAELLGHNFFAVKHELYYHREIIKATGKVKTEFYENLVRHPPYTRTVLFPYADCSFHQSSISTYFNPYPAASSSFTDIFFTCCAHSFDFLSPMKYTCSYEPQENIRGQ